MRESLCGNFKGGDRLRVIIRLTLNGLVTAKSKHWSRHMVTSILRGREAYSLEEPDFPEKGKGTRVGGGKLVVLGGRRVMGVG